MAGITRRAGRRRDRRRFEPRWCRATPAPERFELQDIAHFLVKTLQVAQVLQLDRKPPALGEPELLITLVFELAGHAINEEMGRTDGRPGSRRDSCRCGERSCTCERSIGPESAWPPLTHGEAVFFKTACGYLLK